MPAKSAKQYGMMAAIAHGAKSKTGIGPSTAKKFVDETPKDKRSMFMKHLKRDKKKDKERG